MATLCQMQSPDFFLILCTSKTITKKQKKNQTTGFNRASPLNSFGFIVFWLKYENGSLNCVFGGGRVSWTMQALTFMSEEHIQQPAFSKVDWFTSFFSYTICEGGTGGGSQGFGCVHSIGYKAHHLEQPE